MARKRFIVELGTGADLHGRDVTKAACRAVTDAVSHGCLCGLMEIVGVDSADKIQVDILIACPEPDAVDLEQVKAAAPIGVVTARAEVGGISAQGLCVPQFGQEGDTIVVANAALTVSVDI